MMTTTQANARTRLNPFAFLSDTDFRFILLIFSILAASIFIYSSLYLSIPNSEAINGNAILSLNAVMAHYPGDSEAALKAKHDAIQQYLVPIDRSEAVWIIGCLLLELSVALVIFLIYPKWKIWRGRLRPLDSSTMPEVQAYLTNLCNGVGLSRSPTFLWRPFNSGKAGLAFGSFGRYYVVLPAGLMLQFYTDRATFHTVVLHELAHLRNADVGKTYFTLSLWWAFVVTALLPVAPWALQSLYLEASSFYLAPSSSQPYYTFNLGWRILALAILVYLSRNAVLRVREVYADVRASIWDGQTDRLMHALRPLQPSKGRRWRWLRLLSVHPDTEERCQTLLDTSKLFRLGFWEVFVTGITVMVALPNIVSFLYSLHIPGSVGGTGAAAAVGAGLFLAPVLVGVIGLGIWRSTVLNLAQGQARVSYYLVRLSLVLGLGMLLGQALSLQDYLLEQLSDYSQNFPLHLGFDVIWSVLLIVSLLFFLYWIEASVSSWLEVAVASSSPNLVYWVNLIITGGVLAIWIGLFYGFRLIVQSEPIALNSDGLISLFDLVTETPFTLYVFVGLWAYPLASWFWRKRVAKSTGASWLFLGSSHQLVLPRQSSFRLGMALIAGFIGAVAFCVLYILIRDMRKLVAPELLNNYMTFGYLMVALAVLLQACVAAVVASRVKRLGWSHGLFAAFIAGCIMTIGIVAINLVFFSKSIPDLATIWLSLQTFFGLYVNGGAILALPVAGGVAALADWARRSKQQNGHNAAIQPLRLAEHISTVNLKNSMVTNRQEQSHRKTTVLAGLVLFMTISSGIVSISSVIRNNQIVAAKTHTNAPEITIALQNPYPPHLGKLVLNDPLGDNSLGYRWSTIPGCTFTGGAYHVEVSQQTSVQLCLASNTNFSNFAYQVQMQFVQAGIGGIIFRANLRPFSLYYFFVGSNGSYFLYSFRKDSPGKEVISGSSSVIHAGLLRLNLVAVVANGSTIDLYANHQKIGTVRDSSTSSGSIGVIAVVANNPTEVVFSNAKVWALE